MGPSRWCRRSPIRFCPHTGRACCLCSGSRHGKQKLRRICGTEIIRCDINMFSFLQLQFYIKFYIIATLGYYSAQGFSLLWTFAFHLRFSLLATLGYYSAIGFPLKTTLGFYSAEKSIFFSFQQLSCLWFRPLKSFLSWHGTLQGPSSCLVRCFRNYKCTRKLSGVWH